MAYMCFNAFFTTTGDAPNCLCKVSVTTAFTSAVDKIFVIWCSYFHSC